VLTRANCALGAGSGLAGVRSPPAIKAISAHLRSATSSTVGFLIPSEGIRIRGKWYPILKMEWIDGEPLNLYIERTSTIRPRCSRSPPLAGNAGRSSAAGIAHGDLQNTAILVASADQADRLRRHVRSRHSAQPRGRQRNTSTFARRRRLLSLYLDAFGVGRFVTLAAWRWIHGCGSGSTAGTVPPSARRFEKPL
jgi:hypothetical protein